jgi:cell division septal protein FtsQ
MSAKSTRSRRGLPFDVPVVAAPTDKRFRRSDVRQGRRTNWRRLLIRSSGIAGAALVLLLVLVWIGGLIISAPFLQVSGINVQGNSRLSQADVLARISHVVGEPLLRVDLHKYQQQLLESPWIASAELWRVLPSSVGVRIVERTPIAIARFADELFLVGADGVVLDRFNSLDARLDLTIVDGLARRASVGDTVDTTRIRLVGRLLHELSPRTDLLDRLSQVDVSNPRNAIVRLRDEPLALYLGEEEFLPRLERWTETASSVRAQLEIDDHMDLRHDLVMFGK